jgi:hypothetical protein
LKTQKTPDRWHIEWQNKAGCHALIISSLKQCWHISRASRELGFHLINYKKF